MAAGLAVLADADALRRVLINLVSNAVRDTILQPYDRVPGVARTAPAGAGLGLAIVRELVGQMGGAVSAQSAVGQGSTFTVALPAA